MNNKEVFFKCWHIFLYLTSDIFLLPVARNLEKAHLNIDGNYDPTILLRASGLID